MSLQAIFFDITAQQAFIRVFIGTLQKAVDTRCLGAALNDTAAVMPIKKSYKTPRNAILTYDCDLHTVDTVIPLETRLEQLQQYFHWTTTVPHINRLHGVWAVLMILYTCIEAQTAVSTQTHPDIAKAYFSQFNRRFELYLCGRLCHIKESKQSELMQMAKMPAEIISRELLFITELYTQFPS